MTLIIILIVLGARQLWEEQNPLHHDTWYVRWHQSLIGQPWLKTNPLLVLILTTAVPVVGVFVLSLVLHPILKFALAVLVLAYSLGRGQFNDVFALYRSAVDGQRWDDACGCLQERPNPTQSVDIAVDPEKWDTLHQRMLTLLGYQGFERLFAVLFWFGLFGPAGALLYRLSVHNLVMLGLTEGSSTMACRWLWALEWIPARLLAISFAITGNFVGCVNKLKVVVFQSSLSSVRVIQQAVLGALSLDDVEVESDVVTLKEISALKQLLARTLWLWLAVLAAMLVFIGA